MSKELDEKLIRLLIEFDEDHDRPYSKTLAEIKAAILEHAVPAKKSTSDYDYLFPEGATRNKGYNQAVTEITEKLK